MPCSIRDDIPGLAQALFPSLVFDISLGIQQMDDYVVEVRTKLSERWPDSRMVVFGHLGDGNIHLVLTVGSHDPDEVHAVETIVYEALGFPYLLSLTGEPGRHVTDFEPEFLR